MLNCFTTIWSELSVNVAVTVTSWFVIVVMLAVALITGATLSMLATTHSAVTISLRSFLRVMKKTVPFASTSTAPV